MPLLEQPESLFIKSRRSRLVGLLAIALFAVVATACGSDQNPGAAPATAVSTARPADQPTPTIERPTTPAVQPTPTPGDQSSLSEEEIAARIKYRGNAGRAIDLISRTAQLLSGIGLGVSRAGDGPVETTEVVRAAIGSFDLARSVLEEEPVPDGLEELHTAILDSIRFYSEAAQTLIEMSESGEFDFFTFQQPFQKGGENFHEAGRLLGEARR